MYNLGKPCILKYYFLQQKRRIDLVTIGDYNVKEKEEVKEDPVLTKVKPAVTKKRVVLIIARTHGGEPPSSFVCQGKLRKR